MPCVRITNGFPKRKCPYNVKGVLNGTRSVRADHGIERAGQTAMDDSRNMIRFPVSAYSFLSGNGLGETIAEHNLFRQRKEVSFAPQGTRGFHVDL